MSFHHLSITQIDDLIEKFRMIVFERVNRYPIAFSCLSKRIKRELQKTTCETQKKQLHELYEALQQNIIVEPSLRIVRNYANYYPNSFCELLR